MHEGNTFLCDPVLTMARSDSPITFPPLEAFNFMSDPNLQEVAVTTVDNTTTPTTPQSHFENDLANIPPTSGMINKTSSLLYPSCKTNDKPFLCFINKDEVEAKIEQFSDIVSPPETITKSSDVQDSAFSPENSKYFTQPNSQSETSFNQDTNVMSLNEINGLLLNPDSNPKPSGNVVNIQDKPVPSTSSSFLCPLKEDGQSTPNKNALAARQNRAKKKVYVEGLEKSVEALQKENRDLAQKLQSVTSDYKNRGAEIEYLKSLLVHQGQLSDILKKVPHIKSVGFPLKSSGKRPCVGGTSPSCCCQCKSNNNNINNNNNKNISENPIPSSSSSSFLSPTTSSPCSLQQRNINIMKDSSVGGVPNEAQKKDPPFRGFSNNSQVDNNNKCLRKTLSGRITKNENQKCFSTWGAKSKKKVTKSTDPTS